MIPPVAGASSRSTGARCQSLWNGTTRAALCTLPFRWCKLRSTKRRSLFSVPVLVLNACQSAMHEAGSRSRETSDGGDSEAPNSHESGYDDVHDEVRAIGSLSQAVGAA